tara:strand:+ start:10686 stop:12662 length:1977 start_codon:yes stop_codon:yes gene_type:complete
MNFYLEADYTPTGDQPEAIKELLSGLKKSQKHQTLLGVTGSGKTFTIANVIKEINRPTLVLCHNKTLAAQLYSEFKNYFPNNLVEYFVSYYDYYQPEAYIPSTGTYIEKDLSINSEIEKLRISTTSSLLSGRKDIIVVSSVSCIYGIGNPEEFNNGMIEFNTGENIKINDLLKKFVSALYSRNDENFNRGNFRIRGNTIDIWPAYTDTAYRILIWDEKIDDIISINPENGNKIDAFNNIKIYPANIFITSDASIKNSISKIKNDLISRLNYFDNAGLKIESKRLSDRVNLDIEMIKELGYCSGIENYSRYFDGRKEGSRPFCLIDFFPNNYITVIDESHVTIPQIRAMYGGDKSRKINLVEHGFRLPSALDNRPLKFDEWEMLNNQTIYVSATPSDYELNKSKGIIVEQLIRPTGLIDPKIIVRDNDNQLEDLLEEIRIRVIKKERILVTTLTKKMAEELTKYLSRFSIKCRYIHSDVDTIERIEILLGLRKGEFDVLIGVNLLREGLDLPEVSLVAILDADKEGFLRSERSLTQTAGRAARNINGLVIMYASKITNSMKLTIDETNRRRKIQNNYNKKNNIIPKAIIKKIESDIENKLNPYSLNISNTDVNIENLNKNQINKKIRETKKQMKEAAENLDFLHAAKLRDYIEKLNEMK